MPNKASKIQADETNLKWWLLFVPRIGGAFGLLLCYLCLFALGRVLGGQRMERAAGRLHDS
jgi:hypothetical protein